VKERMKQRGDCVEWKDFENRIESAKKETHLKNLADHIIPADRTPEEVFDDVFTIISKKL
jgi:dephospho-CoA kinase